ncbi:SMI1/KNR4 family protein [Chitinophaga pinensis]|uniref:SMI1/KNR4 family protein n=1 Tax=Chitinophaga pinensis TaxID=79329 RepID=A0A5C6LI11_9BACT|nr:SMI1/KNR4 family protein [Chitinophaga pinensis]TWV90575.1 SMI1/KNR4 family protein [Chitinophaga pinensis]
MEIENVIDLVINYWKTQGIKITPKSVDEVDRIQIYKNLKIPDDFKVFYFHVNGMEELYPNETDEEGFLFYPLEKVVSVEKEFVLSKLSNKQNIYIFSEYMHRSWWYGFELIDDERYRIGIIPDKDSFVPITDSLSGFLNLYLENSSKLYDY